MEKYSENADKVIVISGGSSGLGLEIVKQFVSFNYRVVNLSRSNPEEWPLLKDKALLKPGVYHIPCDILKPENIEDAIELVKTKFGKIDILINNAGVGISGATELLPDEEVEKVMSLCYTSALRLCREALKIMQKGSKIVNISSVCALFPVPYRSVYCSAKAAMNMLSYSLRMELKNFGIAVVSVCPGEIKTGFTKNRLKFDYTNEKYADSPKKSAEAIDKNDHKRMSAAKVAKKVYKISVKGKGPLYIIGAKYKFFYFAKRFMPTGLFHAIIRKVFIK